MTDLPPTLVDRVWRWVKDHHVSAAVMIWVATVTGVAALTDSVDTLRRRWFGPPASETSEYCELLVPLTAQWDRTKAAFDRWTSKNLPLETQIIKPANEAARSLLLQKAGFVHESLRDDAKEFVRHYDCWLEEYDRQRERNGGTDEPFVFVAPQGCGFPTGSETRFRARAADLARRLGAQACG
jgi:hypothetical protein